MQNTFRFLPIATLTLVLGGLSLPSSVCAQEPLPPAKTDIPIIHYDAPETQNAEQAPRTEVVFCIDCSGSMSDALTEAQQVMSGLIQEMQEQNPDAPIRVGVIRYGTGTDAMEVCPLTDDEKAYSSYLSKLKIAGGAEFVGAFINKAMAQMAWSRESNVTRRIIMVGNETAFQGPIDYRQAAANARRNGFTVSAVYCPMYGDEQSANRARAMRFTRTSTRRNSSQSQGFTYQNLDAIDLENTWLLTAYFGGGEVLKLSANPNQPLLRLTNGEVQYIVDQVLPQLAEDDLRARMAFRLYDKGRLGTQSGQPGMSSSFRSKKL